MSNNSVQEILDDWKEQLAESPATFHMMVYADDVKELIKYFEDIDNFASNN